MDGWTSVCVLGFFVLVFLHLLPWSIHQIKTVVIMAQGLKKQK